MNSIDLHDFCAMFKTVRSMAIIGNSDVILQWQNGALIDACDMIVRFNCAFTKGLENHIGSRTDVLVANRTYSLRKAPSPASVLNPRCIVSFVEPAGDIDYSDFREWVGDIPTVISFAPDLLGLGHGERTRPVMMGTNAVYAFLRLFPVERLYISGFNLYGAAAGGSGTYCGNQERKSRGLWHDLDEEARIFAAILGRFEGELIATPEVEDLLQRHSQGPARKFSVQGDKPMRTSLLERIYARIAWRLIRWGMKMRRRAERNGTVRI
jgi:hypothetical protein